MCGDGGNVKLGTLEVILGSAILDQDGLDRGVAYWASGIRGSIDVSDREWSAECAKG